jgi:hypothetical protein
VHLLPNAISVSNEVNSQLALRGIITRVCWDATAVTAAMSSQLIKVRDCLVLGKGARADILVESTESASDVRHTGDLLPISPMSLRASRDSVPDLFHCACGRVANAASPAGRAATTVDAKSCLFPLGRLGIFFLHGSFRDFFFLPFIYAWLCVCHHICGQFAVVHIVAGIRGDAAAGFASVVDELLHVIDSLGDRPLSTVGFLIEDAERWLPDVGRLNTRNVFSVGELLVLVYALNWPWACPKIPLEPVQRRLP